VTSYWISHPNQCAFISAFSPEAVGQFLMISGRWPAGHYTIRTHGHARSSSEAGDPPWGYAIKGGNGDVLVECGDEPI
jgi:hypothetical protein